MSFQSLGLSDALLQAISKKGYTTPTPIQAKSIPLILDRKDVLASAQTGTGKTAGFALPIIQLLSEQSFEQRRPIRCLILTPTRELAAQVHAEIKEYSAGSGLTSTVIFGGVNQNPQVAALKRGVDILIATPGRLMDLHNQKELSLRAVEILVLDEADRMLDMGFLRDIRTIMNLMPAKRQNLLFSATFSKEIRTLADTILHNPISVEATPENSTAEKVEQKILMVDKGDKITVLSKLIVDGNWEQVLVFTRTKHGANKLTEKLVKQNISAAAIHGNKTQNARTKALDSFKKGTIRILVATDIAARGLDIPLLPHVVNFELPNVPEDYVHRIGRTGRAGASGEALSLVAADEVEFMRGIEKLLGQKFDAEEMVGFEPTEVYNANTPKANPNNKRHQGNRPKPSFNKNKSSFKSRRY